MRYIVYFAILSLMVGVNLYNEAQAHPDPEPHTHNDGR